MKLQNKKNKTVQYVIAASVAVVILGAWISSPLMSGSSMDSAVSAGNPFKSKVADIALLGGDNGAPAPGSPLSGEMIDNPATSGLGSASALFQSGASGDSGAGASASADASNAAPAPSASGNAPSPSFGGPHSRLQAAPSISGGNANSMTAGSSLHDKFFGTGNNKAEFSPAGGDLPKSGLNDKKSPSLLVAMLGSSAQKSQDAAGAARSGNLAAASNGASTAFGGAAAHGSGMDLSGQLEDQTVASGLQMGQTAQDLKKNDPSLNKTKITPPSKPKDAATDDQQMKQQIMMMIIQMVLKMALGAVFGGVGL
jgi:hypothetical protein